MFTDDEVDTLLHALTVLCAIENLSFRKANELHTKILMNREAITGKDSVQMIKYEEVYEKSNS